MDAAGSEVSYINDWYFLRGSLYLLSVKTNDPSSLFLIYLSLQDSPPKHLYLFLCRALSSTHKLLIFVGQITLPSVFCCRLPSQQNCGLTNWNTTQDRVFPRPGWRRLLQRDRMVVPHLFCKVFWTLQFIVWKVITRRRTNEAVGGEGVSEK